MAGADHLETRVGQVETEVSTVKRDVHDLRTEVSAKFDQVFGALNSISNSIATLNATKGDTWGTIHGVVKVAGFFLFLFVSSVGGIVWMNTVMTENALAKVRLEIQTSRIEQLQSELASMKATKVSEVLPWSATTRTR